MIQPYLKREEDCPECNGDGNIYIANPFGAERVSCDECRGTGKIWV